MDKESRKALRAAYKEQKTYMGVFQIKSQLNGKVYIGATNNLKSKWITLKMQLDSGRFANKALQADWKNFGPDTFTYEVLEQKSTEDMLDVKWEVKQMEKAWLKKRLPFEDKGYNTYPRDWDHA